MTNPELAEAIRTITRQNITKKVFPGAVVGYIDRDQTAILPIGKLNYQPDSPVVTAETVYDVASVTKSIPTATLILQALESGQLALDDSVKQFIPALSNQFQSRLTIRHLLTYTAIWDLPGGLSRMASRIPGSFLRELFTTELVAPPGERYFYTNPPALLLGIILQQLSGKPIDNLAQERIFNPLGMTHSSFQPDPERGQIAPSEVTDDRGELIGEPNDETAWHLRQNGLISGNAGLFTSVPDLLKFASMVLENGKYNGQQILQPTTIAQMRQNQLSGIHAYSGLGWEIHRPEVMGTAARQGIIMKSGFTGCLIVIDVDRQRAMVHLSNRTYPQRPAREPIRAYWRSLNQLIFTDT